MKNQDKIVKILGGNHTIPVVFSNKEIKISALYTYKKEVFVIDKGWDFSIDELPEKEIEDIIVELEKGNYVLDPTIQ